MGGRHGDGSIIERKLASGTTVYDTYWSHRDSQTGQRKRGVKKGFASKKEASTHLRRVTSAVDSGSYVKTSTITVRDYFDAWIKRARLKPQTRSGYADKIRLHINPALGHHRMADLRGHHLNEFYRQLETVGSPGGRGALSLSTVRQIHFIISAAYTDAIKEGSLGLQVSPTKRADPPRAKAAAAARPRWRTWTGDEVRTFLKHCSEQDDHYLPIWRVLVATGCRRGEALGLRWEDVNFKRKTLTLRETIGEARDDETADDGTVSRVRKLIVGPTKNDVPRVIHLDAVTLQVLTKHRERQSAERDRLADRWSDEGLVFCRGERWLGQTAQAGAPLDPERVTQAFARRVAMAEVPVIRLHDLRHTWATLALQEGVHPKVVQDRLGHSQISVTLDIYSHVTEGMGREAADTVADLFAPNAAREDRKTLPRRREPSVVRCHWG